MNSRSPKHNELMLASYNKNPSAFNDPDGLVLVWNSMHQHFSNIKAHMPTRPEFTFYAQSPVLSASFSEFHPNYIVGGTYAGQILLWDTRAR
jgi:dynein intermediate chain